MLSIINAVPSITVFANLNNKLGFGTVAWYIIKGLELYGFDVEAKPIDVSIKRSRGLVIGDLGALLMMADSVDELYGYVVVEGPVNRHLDLVEKAMSKAVAVAVPSEFVASELIRFRRDVVVVPHGIDLNRYKCGGSEKWFDLGIVVSYPHYHKAIALRKGIDYYAYVLSSTSYSAVSTYGFLHLLKYVIKDKKYRKVVMDRLNAVVPHTSDPRLVYCKSKVLLWLSRSEGFGLPPLEAMASGTPTVYTDAPAHNKHTCCFKVRTVLRGVIDLPSRGMYRFVPYSYYNYEIADMDELLNTVDYAVSHYSEYSDEARRVAEQYDVQQMVEGIVSLIKK